MVRTPLPVVLTVALGLAAAPLLWIYAGLLLVHGLIAPVYPPDVGGSLAAETMWGVAALAFAAVLVLGAYRFLQRQGRVLHLLAQLAVLAGCVALLLDPSSGSPTVPLLLGAASVGATIAAVVRTSRNWIGPDPEGGPT